MWPTNICLILAARTLNALAAFFTIETTLMLLMENLQLEHNVATYIQGGGGFLIALFAMVTASAVDTLATPWLPLIACVAATLARGGLALVVTYNNTGTIVPSLLLLLTILALDQVLVGMALWLALDRTVERSLYTDNTAMLNRISGVAYALDNVAALVAALVYDALRTYAPNPSTANVLVQWLGLLASLATVVILLPMLYWPPAGPRLSSKPAISCVQFFRETSLWRFVAFSLVLLGVASIFRHMDQTLPVVMQRLYDSRVHFALIQAINPALVIPLSIVMQYWNAQRHSYWVIAGGTAISSASVLVLVIAAAATNNHPNHGPATSFLDYLPYIFFMALFSLGESIWSARLTAYMLQVAPEKQKAMYLTVAKLPQLGARLVAAWHSAWLVEHYCPPLTSLIPCQPRDLWLQVWGFSVITPVVLILGFRFLNPAKRPLLLSEVSLVESEAG